MLCGGSDGGPVITTIPSTHRTHNNDPFPLHDETLSVGFMCLSLATVIINRLFVTSSTFDLMFHVVSTAVS